MSNSGIELEGLAIAVQVFAGPRLLMSEKSYVEDNNPSITVARVIRCPWDGG
jgi:hypothetical protein